MPFRYDLLLGRELAEIYCVLCKAHALCFMLTIQTAQKVSAWLADHGFKLSTTKTGNSLQQKRAKLIPTATYIKSTSYFLPHYKLPKEWPLIEHLGFNISTIKSTMFPWWRSHNISQLQITIILRLTTRHK